MIGAENIIYLNREGDYFSARIPPETFDSRNMFYLMLKMDGDSVEVQDVIQRMVNILQRGKDARPRKKGPARHASRPDNRPAPRLAEAGRLSLL